MMNSYEEVSEYQAWGGAKREPASARQPGREQAANQTKSWYFHECQQNPTI